MQAFNITIFGIIAVSINVRIVNVLCGKLCFPHSFLLANYTDISI